MILIFESWVHIVRIPWLSPISYPTSSHVRNPTKTSPASPTDRLALLYISTSDSWKRESCMAASQTHNAYYPPIARKAEKDWVKPKSPLCGEVPQNYKLVTCWLAWDPEINLTDVCITVHKPSGPAQNRSWNWRSVQLTSCNPEDEIWLCERKKGNVDPAECWRDAAGVKI